MQAMKAKIVSHYNRWKNKRINVQTYMNFSSKTEFFNYPSTFPTLTLKRNGP